VPPTLDLDWCGERFTLLAERALWWPAEGALVVADLHLGKAASFRAQGVPAPEAVTSADLRRLSGAIERCRAERLVVLGDLVHASNGLTAPLLESFGAWRQRHAGLDVLMVRGNHDRRAGDPPRDWRIEPVDGPYRLGGLDLVHEPEHARRRAALAGHVHPAASARASQGPARLRAPCFWFAERLAVLPAFGGFTGCRVVKPARGERVFVLGEGAVAELAPSSISAV
jgi:DNA ligase-associated metallophosphoesterase